MGITEGRQIHRVTMIGIASSLGVVSLKKKKGVSGKLGFLSTENITEKRQ